MSDKYLRDVETLESGNLLPGFASFMPDDQRHKAIVEVLRRIPEDDYNFLVGEQESFSWFVPDVRVKSVLYPFSLSYQKAEGLSAFARVLYLSSGLEDEKFETAVAEVVHQLAHVVLEHEVCAHMDDVTEEKDAHELADEWGF